MNIAEKMRLVAIGTSVTLVSCAASAHAADYYCKTLAGSASTSAAEERLMERVLANAIPMHKSARSLPKALFRASPAVGRVTRTPGIVEPAAATESNLQSGAPKAEDPRKGTASVVPRNFGQNPLGSGNNKNTIYHYTDRRVDTELMNNNPYRRAGHFAFVAADNGSYRCTASLIRQSIAITAGHCVHQGGNRSTGWIKSAQFHPGYNNGVSPYGFARAKYVCTTSGWYNFGFIQSGYDVGLVVLHKRDDANKQIGAYTGTFGFCHTNCLFTYWYMTQLGYPENYDGGTLMQEGQHLANNPDNTDYYFGSGMQAGSSGGPHVANLGTLSDSSFDKGVYSARNVIFAVTSWGYVDDIYKIQGASSTSGPNNGNKFKALFNAACSLTRTLHGASACTNLP